MKMKSKFTIALATTAAVASSVYTVPAEAVTMPFTDVKNEGKDVELYKAVTELYSKGIVFGTSSTQFSPYNTITRGEAAAFLAKALQLKTDNVENPNFKDVPTSHKYYKEIAALAANSIIDKDRENYDPNGVFRRSHVAKMLTLGFNLDKSTELTAKFTDFTPTKETNIYIQTLVDYGITEGTTATTFSPNGSLTRKQMTLFLYRTMQKLEDDFYIVSVE
ncbi:MAG: S-layer homology domain-containing protein [Lysinibacillus sp.]